jgi:CRP/FNR family cyclic AMP-dependent transcriptional regulator
MAEISKSPAFWRSFPIFEEFSNELIAEVVTLAQWKRWAPGTTLFQRGDEGNYMLLVTEGRIKVSLMSVQGKELALRHFEAGALVGELSVLEGEPRSADATVAVATEGYVIGKTEFMSFITRHPAAVEAVMRFLCKRLRETNQQLESIALYDLDSRVARFFLATLRQIHGDDLPDEANLHLALSQAEIAGILGASRPKVNRSIHSLETAGAIKREGNIINCNIARLIRLAEPHDEE